MLLVHALGYADRKHFEYEYAYMLRHKDTLVPELETQGVLVHLVPGRSNGDLMRAPWRLPQLIRERDIDLVHAHLPVAGMVARVGGVLGRVPVLCTEHNLNDRSTRWGNRLTWPLNAGMAAVSGPVAESIHSTTPHRPRARVRTVVNRIDVEQFAEVRGREEIRGQFGIAADTLLSDRQRLAAVGYAARAGVRRDFSVERMVREYEQFYETLLASRRWTSSCAFLKGSRSL